MRVNATAIHQQPPPVYEICPACTRSLFLVLTIWPTEAGEESLESLVGERVWGVSLTSVGRTGVVYQLELVETLTRREAGRQLPEK